LLSKTTEMAKGVIFANVGKGILAEQSTTMTAVSVLGDHDCSASMLNGFDSRSKVLCLDKVFTDLLVSASVVMIGDGRREERRQCRKREVRSEER
jgi:hypothetical protein